MKLESMQEAQEWMARFGIHLPRGAGISLSRMTGELAFEYKGETIRMKPDEGGRPRVLELPPGGGFLLTAPDTSRPRIEEWSNGGVPQSTTTLERIVDKRRAAPPELGGTVSAPPGGLRTGPQEFKPSQAPIVVVTSKDFAEVRVPLANGGLLSIGQVPLPELPCRAKVRFNWSGQDYDMVVDLPGKRPQFTHPDQQVPTVSPWQLGGRRMLDVQDPEGSGYYPQQGVQ